MRNFPRVDDWRFDLGDIVVSLGGEEGVVCEQSMSGPVIHRRDSAGGDHCFGWGLLKRWLIGEFVRHISGVCGAVVNVKEEVGEVTIRDISDNLDYDFVSHTNSFRRDQRDKHAVGFAASIALKAGHCVPTWVEALKLGPNAVKNNLDLACFHLIVPNNVDNSNGNGDRGGNWSSNKMCWFSVVLELYQISYQLSVFSLVNSGNLGSVT